MSTTDFQSNEGRGVIMPQAPDAEKSVLSMMAISPEYIMDRCISEGMTGEYFYIPAHRILWSIIRDRHEKGEQIDATSVAQELTDRRQLDAAGGYAGLNDILSYSTTTALFKPHFDILKEKYIRRSIILTANRAAEAAFKGEVEVETLLDQTEQNVLQIRQNTATNEEWSLKKDVKQVIYEIEHMMTRKGEVTGLTTGYPKLDRMINGLNPSELFVIAARPSMGKTSFLLNIVEHLVLGLKKPVLVFSCEMPSKKIVERILYARSGVCRRMILEGGSQLPKDDLKRLGNAAREVKNSPLIIDDTAGITIAELRAKARRVLREHPDLCAIGIDYLQLMHSRSKQAQNSREREIAEISGGLKALAKELNLPIIVLAQLNRAAESRVGANKGMPMMSDLRDSGSIEQDADMVGLLYRASYYAEDEDEREEKGNAALLRLAKNRNGETGDIPLTFCAELMRFEPA